MHFNFGGICDRSVKSLTPSGEPQPICSRPPNPGEGEEGEQGHIWLMMVWIKQKEMERILLSVQKHEWIKM